MDNITSALQRLEAKICSDIETIPRLFTGLLYPEWQQALPARTLLQCKPVDTLTNPLIIPKGSRLTASHPGQGELALATSENFQLLPLTITHIDYQAYLGAGRLSVGLQWHPGVKHEREFGEDTLRFYLNIPWPDVTRAYYALTQQLQGVHWETSTTLVPLSPDCCKPAGLNHLPDDPYLLWRDYVCFVQQFLFIDIQLPEGLLRNSVNQTITLHFLLKTFDKKAQPLFLPASLLLNCVPVVNAVTTLAAPVMYTQDASPLAIKPLTASIHASADIISIDKVSAYTEDQATAIPCYHQGDLFAPDEGQPSLVWHAFYEDGWQLSITAQNTALMREPGTVLQCTVSQCEGDLANHIPFANWEFHWQDPTVTRLCECHALGPFSQYVPAPESSTWELLLQSRHELSACWSVLAAYNAPEVALLRSTFAKIALQSELRIDPSHHFFYQAETHHWQLDDSVSLPRCSLMLQIYATFITALGEPTRPCQVRVSTREGGAWLWPTSSNG